MNSTSVHLFLQQMIEKQSHIEFHVYCDFTSAVFHVFTLCVPIRYPSVIESSRFEAIFTQFKHIWPPTGQSNNTLMFK